MEQLHDSEVLLLAIYLQEIKSVYGRTESNPMFIAALNISYFIMIPLKLPHSFHFSRIHVALIDALLK